jgi:hypothetical protein
MKIGDSRSLHAVTKCFIGLSTLVCADAYNGTVKSLHLFFLHIFDYFEKFYVLHGKSSKLKSQVSNFINYFLVSDPRTVQFPHLHIANIDCYLLNAFIF